MAVSVTVAVSVNGGGLSNSGGRGSGKQLLTVENLKQLSCVKEKVDRLSKSVNKHVTGPAVG